MPDELQHPLERIAEGWCKSKIHAAAAQTVNELAEAFNVTATTPADVYALVRLVTDIRSSNRSMLAQVAAAHEELAAVLHDHGVEVTHLPGLAQVVDRAVNHIKVDAQTVRQLDADRTRATQQRDKAIDDANSLRDEGERAKTLTARLVERTTERDAWKQRTARLAETLEEVLDGFGKVHDGDSTGCMRGSVPQATVARWRKVLAEQGNPTTPVRCRSCDYLWDHHGGEGCWYTVAAGTPDRNLTCPCAAVNPANSATAGPPCPTCGRPCPYTAFGAGEAYCEPCGNEFRSDANPDLLNRLADQLDQAAVGDINAIPLPAGQVRALLRVVDAVNTLQQSADNHTRVEWGVRAHYRDGSSSNHWRDSEDDARTSLATIRRHVAAGDEDWTGAELIRRAVSEWQTVPEATAQDETSQ